MCSNPRLFGTPYSCAIYHVQTLQSNPITKTQGSPLARLKFIYTKSTILSSTSPFLAMTSISYRLVWTTNGRHEEFKMYLNLQNSCRKVGIRLERVWHFCLRNSIGRSDPIGKANYARDNSVHARRCPSFCGEPSPLKPSSSSGRATVTSCYLSPAKPAISRSKKRRSAFATTRAAPEIFAHVHLQSPCLSASDPRPCRDGRLLGEEAVGQCWWCWWW
jgi:hypothetical protein